MRRHLNLVGKSLLLPPPVAGAPRFPVLRLTRLLSLLQTRRLIDGKMSEELREGEILFFHFKINVSSVSNCGAMHCG